MRVFLMVFSLFLNSVANSQPVYPPKIGAEYNFAFLQPCSDVDEDGINLTPQALSISIERVVDGTPIVCVGIVACDTRQERKVSVSITGNRQAFYGRAWSEGFCQGESSERSDETAYTYPGVGPKKPKLK